MMKIPSFWSLVRCERALMMVFPSGASETWSAADGFCVPAQCLPKELIVVETILFETF